MNDFEMHSIEPLNSCKLNTKFKMHYENGRADRQSVNGFMAHRTTHSSFLNWNTYEMKIT